MEDYIPIQEQKDFQEMEHSEQMYQDMHGEKSQTIEKQKGMFEETDEIVEDIFEYLTDLFEPKK